MKTKILVFIPVYKRAEVVAKCYDRLAILQTYDPKRFDIDVLVVMPEGVHCRRTAQMLYRQIRELGVPFDILVTTPSVLEKHKDNIGLIYRAVLKEGREIYAA